MWQVFASNRGLVKAQPKKKNDPTSHPGKLFDIKLHQSWKNNSAHSLGMKHLSSIRHLLIDFLCVLCSILECILAPHSLIKNTFGLTDVYSNR